MRHGGESTDYRNVAGERINRDAFEQLLPFQYAGQLITDGRMPAEICGIVPDYNKISMERSFVKVEPSMLDMPTPNFRPLFEAQSGRLELEAPKDFLRLGKDLEFFVAASNSVDEAKSALFRQALEDIKFRMPAKLVAGNPDTRKAYDEGLYALDADGNLFLIMQKRGQPFVENIAASMSAEDAAQLATLNIRHIVVQEQKNRDIRALLIEADSTVWILHGAGFVLSRIELQGYDYARDELMLRGDMLNYVATVRNEDRIEVLAMDRNFEPLARYGEELMNRSKSRAGRVAAYLLPLALEFDNGKSGYLGIHID